MKGSSFTLLELFVSHDLVQLYLVFFHRVKIISIMLRIVKVNIQEMMGLSTMKCFLDAAILIYCSYVPFILAPRDILSPIYNLPYPFGNDQFNVIAQIIRFISAGFIQIWHIMGTAFEQSPLYAGGQTVSGMDTWFEVVLDFGILDGLGSHESSWDCVPLRILLKIFVLQDFQHLQMFDLSIIQRDFAIRTDYLFLIYQNSQKTIKRWKYIDSKKKLYINILAIKEIFVYIDTNIIFLLAIEINLFLSVSVYLVSVII